VNTHHLTLSTLALALGCAPATDPQEGLSSTTTAPSTDPVQSLPANEVIMGHTAQPASIDGLFPPTAGGEPSPREGVLRCASEAERWDSPYLETFLFEAEHTGNGPEIHMARLRIHDTGTDPSIEVTASTTDFTWNKERVWLWVEAEEAGGVVHSTSLQVAAVAGSEGHLFVGGGYHFCFPMNFVCWDDQLQPRFTYDAETGECTDGEGRTGLNAWPIEMIRETGNAECADLRGVAVEEGDHTYPVLRDWNLRGALLDGGSLYFAILENASLEGADFSGMTMGYVQIDGTIDGFTQLPDAPCERFFDGTVFCSL